MEFKLAESRVYPKEIEETRNGMFYIRKNIREEIREDLPMYIYDEALVSANEYIIYIATQEIDEKKQEEIIDNYTLQLIEEGIL